MKVAGHLRIEETKLAPGREWTGQSEAWYFVRASAGVAYWLEPGKPRSFSEKEVAVVAPGRTTVVRASQLSEVTLHGFAFSPGVLGGFFTLTERQLFDLATAGCAPVRFLPSTHPVALAFAAVLSRRKTTQELPLRAELLALALSALTESLPRARRSRGAYSPARSRFHEMVSQMPDFEIARHTPEELARLCGCSARHFNRLFHQQFGQSPRALQTEVRLAKARQMLGTTEEKILEIAQASGYRSLSLFNSLFKRRFGLSPSAWRAQAAEGPGPK